jgi:hypothetical protein
MLTLAVLLEPKQVLVHHFLSEFARIIRKTENLLDNWDVVKNKISLVDIRSQVA